MWKDEDMVSVSKRYTSDSQTWEVQPSQAEQASSVLPIDTQPKETNRVQKLHSHSCAGQLGKHSGIVAEQVGGGIYYFLPLKG